MQAHRYQTPHTAYMLLIVTPTVWLVRNAGEASPNSWQWCIEIAALNSLYCSTVNWPCSACMCSVYLCLISSSNINFVFTATRQWCSSVGMLTLTSGQLSLRWRLRSMLCWPQWLDTWISQRLVTLVKRSTQNQIQIRYGSYIEKSILLWLFVFIFLHRQALSLDEEEEEELPDVFNTPPRKPSILSEFVRWMSGSGSRSSGRSGASSSSYSQMYHESSTWLQLMEAAQFFSFMTFRFFRIILVMGSW